MNSTKNKFQKTLNLLRFELVKMSNMAKAAHLASSLSCIDIIATLYYSVLNIIPKNLKSLNRDRFILSKGHAATALYAVLAYRGFFNKKKLLDYAKQNSLLEEHPNPKLNGVEAATGSLGHGLSIGCGLALGGKISKKKYFTYVLLGDGECDEGSVWEAALFASSKKLDKLIAIIDYNKWQGIGRTNEILNLEPLNSKWKSFGWNTFKVDGHQPKKIIKIIKKIKNNLNGKPNVIIANTIKGKGVDFMEDDNNWHYRIPTLDEVKKVKRILDLK